MGIYDTIIIGGGPAGITAGIYAKRLGLDTLVIERELIGGKLHYIDKIFNYPGYPSISGIYLAEIMSKQLKATGVDILLNEVDGIILDGKIKKVYTKSKSYDCKSIIVCTGSESKRHPKINGYHVSHCELCDGFLCQSKNSSVIGGGNSAYEAAIYLSSICNQVNIIVRGEVSAEKTLIDSVKKLNNVREIKAAQAERYDGEKLILSNGETIESEYVFVKIGQTLGKRFEGLKISNGFYANDSGVDGIYVAGDCIDKEIKQIVTATSDGAKSAINCFKFLKKIQ